MDKLKGVAKGGWHPSNNSPIHRESWKSDLKGIATGKKADPYESSRDHQSTPLASLKDPASFAPPPKHSAYYPDAQNPSASSASTPGGPPSRSAVPVPAPPRQPQQQQLQSPEQVQEQEAKPPSGPYRTDTTGLRTDNLPKPPVRRANGEVSGGSISPMRTASPSLPPRTASPSLPPRQNAPGALPPRQQTAKPPPSLPPRMTESPTEFTPAPPPTYGEATRPQPGTGFINQNSVSRLGHAGISVPGFGIGGTEHATAPRSPAAQQGHGGQLSELQQRFSRMNAGSGIQASQAQAPVAAAIAAGKKAAPPPPPKKKSSLVSGDSRQQSSDGSAAPIPPPIPMSSKPKPGG